MEGVCHYCNQKKMLCKAHIIPETFYKTQEKTHYLGMFTDGTIDCIHSQNGFKDGSILCAECDAILGNYDKYGAEILKKKLLKNPRILSGCYKEQLYALDKKQIDYSKLRKFFISLVWRASISKLCNVSLGKYEDIALKIMKNEIPDDNNLFHPIIMHRPKEYMLRNVAYVTMKRLFNQNSILVTFPGYEIVIITNCYPIRNNQTFKKYFSNVKELVAFDMNVDINKTQNLVSFIVGQIRNKHGGKLPTLHIK